MGSKKSMQEQFMSTIKSTEIMDWEDLHVMRKICFYLAYFFNKFDINPNTITIWSMILGAGSAWFFAHASYHYAGVEGLIFNIIAIGMLYVADVFDNTDGQLARLSGKSSKIGRILDGVAGFVWFFPIYFVLICRMYQYHDIEFGLLGIEDTQTNAIIYCILVFLFVLFAGVTGTSGQQRMSDYYVQVHLFFQKGEDGSEFDNSSQQHNEYVAMTKENSTWFERLFMMNYVGYTRLQEKATPKFQRFLQVSKQKYGSVLDMPSEIREKMHQASYRLMWLNHLIAFKYRAISLAVFVLLDMPLLHFFVEGVVLGAITKYYIYQHEKRCAELTDEL